MKDFATIRKTKYGPELVITQNGNTKSISVTKKMLSIITIAIDAYNEGEFKKQFGHLEY